ncbi:hypothetical protein AMAG_03801 [Allomyces macrogynus ATCC 38327]|uniref:Protein farnesyltransferase/geranylgeranyltransferase type-1 subunit alpha n=1 Tax=Allomyces macrogynus (strain ATCC 38327) TaxID=578462 RepID=A0A0L0SAW2_ALLM3|nr:hypothetical protein AMAG_03801 [Allomyces macrogynus ATCC 38327]|eukprot:KNE59534.1 hypothetical protein AMAG_03801 [Allomyces macrogynus ATCC 38327]
MTTALPYRERPEWADVTPVPLNEGPRPFAPILFSKEYQEAFEYFTAVTQANEISQRAFDLTTHLVTLNPGLYSAWYFRQQLIEELKLDLHKELEFVTGRLLETPKNYQMWNHRQYIISKLGDYSKEKELMDHVLEIDAKNYHVWVYRQWLVAHFGLWDGELECVNDLLTKDVRNNSAWSYRYFLLYGSAAANAPIGADEPNGPQRTLAVDDDEEFQFVCDQILRAPSNESPWVYLRGVLRHLAQRAKVPAIQTPAAVKAVCERLVKGQSQSPHLYGFLVDEAEAHNDWTGVRDTCLHLEEVVDKTRRRYWAMRRQVAERALAAAAPGNIAPTATAQVS